MEENFWFSSSLNLPKNNYTQTIMNTKEIKWESLKTDEFKKIIDKILKAYDVVERDYLKYANDVLSKDHKFKNYKLSGVNATKEDILLNTKNVGKGLKNSTQTESISVTIKT